MGLAALVEVIYAIYLHYSVVEHVLGDFRDGDCRIEIVVVCCVRISPGLLGYIADDCLDVEAVTFGVVFLGA